MCRFNIYFSIFYIEMDNILKNLKLQLEKTLDFFKSDIAVLRTGRPTPALVEGIMVDAYGQKMSIEQLASITVSPPNLIIINPWDKGTMEAISKAIASSQLGLSPAVEQDFIRITLPQMTQEKREQLVKLLNEKAEHTRISVRTERENALKHLQKMEKDKEISEDQWFKGKEEVQKFVDEYNGKIKQVAESKEKEIITL